MWHGEFLARGARRQSWVNEPTAEFRPRLVYFEAARNPPTASLARLRIWPSPRAPRADRSDARAGDGVPRGGSHGGRGPPGSTPHHPRDAATTPVRAGHARAMRQNVDGSSLWRPSLGFRGRAELHRVVMCMVCVHAVCEIVLNSDALGSIVPDQWLITHNLKTTQEAAHTHKAWSYDLLTKPEECIYTFFTRTFTRTYLDKPSCAWCLCMWAEAKDDMILWYDIMLHVHSIHKEVWTLLSRTVVWRVKGNVGFISMLNTLMKQHFRLREGSLDQSSRSQAPGFRRGLLQPGTWLVATS
jgi:hypothetical protein